MQLLLWQSVAAPQGCPFGFRQLPFPSHWFGDAQVPVSVWPLGTFEQVPTEPPTLHAWQVPVHVVLQQTPSTQLPLTQSELPPGQFCPLIFLQAPIPSHALLPLQLGLLSVRPLAMFEQVPSLPAMLHAWHVPVHAEVQQTPSTQVLLPAHWLLVMHEAPVGSLVTHCEFDVLQNAVGAHCASVLHIVLQAPLAQL